MSLLVRALTGRRISGNIGRHSREISYDECPTWWGFVTSSEGKTLTTKVGREGVAVGQLTVAQCPRSTNALDSTRRRDDMRVAVF